MHIILKPVSTKYISKPTTPWEKFISEPLAVISFAKVKTALDLKPSAEQSLQPPNWKKKLTECHLKGIKRTHTNTE